MAASLWLISRILENLILTIFANFIAFHGGEIFQRSLPFLLMSSLIL